MAWRWRVTRPQREGCDRFQFPLRRPIRKLYFPPLRYLVKQRFHAARLTRRVRQKTRHFSPHRYFYTKYINRKEFLALLQEEYECFVEAGFWLPINSKHPHLRLIVD